MTRRFFTRADINPLNPEPRAICDRCGQEVTLSTLRWQHQYVGGTYQNRKLLVCNICYDLPSDTANLEHITFQVLAPSGDFVLAPGGQYVKASS